jgi:hypothetical protein
MTDREKPEVNYSDLAAETDRIDLELLDEEHEILADDLG